MGHETNGKRAIPDDVITKSINWLGNACIMGGGRKTSSKCTFRQVSRLLTTIVEVLQD